MRIKLFAATALGSTLIIGIGAGAAGAAPQPAGHHVSQAEGASAARVAPADVVAALGDLGNVTQKVNELVQAGAPAKGAPDAAAVKQKRADLQSATDALLKRTGGSGAVLAAPAKHKRVVDVKSAVDKVSKDADALTSKATAAKPNPDDLTAAVKPLSTDDLGLVTAVATKLGGAGLPTSSVPATG